MCRACFPGSCCGNRLRQGQLSQRATPSKESQWYLKGSRNILTKIDRVDFTGVLDPMTLADFDALIRSQNANSSPGCSGIRYGHLRAMGPKARQVCVLLINRYLRFQEAPSAWLDVGIALIPKSDGLAGTWGRSADQPPGDTAEANDSVRWTEDQERTSTSSLALRPLASSQATRPHAPPAAL
jgi:hypothetical protein